MNPVSAKTVASVAIIESCLKRVYSKLMESAYLDTNLPSCMTLDVKNVHSTVHYKQPNMSQLV